METPQIGENMADFRQFDVAITSDRQVELTKSNTMQNIIDRCGVGILRPGSLPEQVLPIVDYIDETRPDIVIGNDRGGRLAALAVHAAWRATRKEIDTTAVTDDGMVFTLKNRRFPTLDGRIHFAHISDSEEPIMLEKRLDAIVENSYREANRRGDMTANQHPNILIIDDWSIRGRTQRLANNMLAKYEGTTAFALLAGNKGRVGAHPRLPGTIAAQLTTWNNNPSQIGVDYIPAEVTYQNGVTYETNVPVANKHVIAREARKALYGAAKNLL